MAFGIFREPAFQDPLFLEEHLMDAPEAAECKTAKYNGNNLIAGNKGGKFPGEGFTKGWELLFMLQR